MIYCTPRKKNSMEAIYILGKTWINPIYKHKMFYLGSKLRGRRIYFADYYGKKTSTFAHLHAPSPLIYKMP